MTTLCVQGRTIHSDQLEWLRGLLREHPPWGRARLSRYIAEQWDWRNGKGQLKDMAARTLLLKLERRGLLQLPQRRSGGGSRPTQLSRRQGPLVTQPVVSAGLSELLPIDLEVMESSFQRQGLRALLDPYHYLGYQRAVGENVAYFARDRTGRVLAGLVFGAAAWKCAPRDRFIGWDPAARERHLPYLANQMRLLIPPWIQVPHLGSHLLGLAAQRLSSDWQGKYGHPLYLLETFVQPDQFSGACYQAANWHRVGQTQNRSRNDRDRTRQVAGKDVYVYPLTPSFRDRLRALSTVCSGQQRPPPSS